MRRAKTPKAPQGGHPLDYLFEGPLDNLSILNRLAKKCPPEPEIVAQVEQMYGVKWDAEKGTFS